MFSHLLKLMWNKRRANSMIFLELLLAFIVLFGVYSFLAFNLERYSSPLGFSYQNSIGVQLDFAEGIDSLTVVQAQQRIHRDLLTIPAVEAATWGGPITLFGEKVWKTGSNENGQTIVSQIMFVDDKFQDALEVDMLEGRWFTEDDYRAKYPPMVVNKEFKERYYPAVTLIDSILDVSGEHRIVGVTGDFKYGGNFEENFPLTFHSQLDWMDEDEKNHFEAIILRLRPGSLADNEEEIYNLLVGATKNPRVVIDDMARERRNANRPVVIPLVILLIVSAFLLINVGLGLFGVLVTQISRRRAEIGLRKAMGATPAEVSAQFVLEVLLVTGAALLLGVFFAVQVPLLDLLPIPDRFFYLGLLGAIATILLIVTLCALLPSRQAAGLQPATVLHEG